MGKKKGVGKDPRTFTGKRISYAPVHKIARLFSRNSYACNIEAKTVKRGHNSLNSGKHLPRAPTQPPQQTCTYAPEGGVGDVKRGEGVNDGHVQREIEGVSRRQPGDVQRNASGIVIKHD